MPSRFIPVSTITSQGSPVSRQRATCAALFSTGRAGDFTATAMSPGRTPCRTESWRSLGQGISARASRQVATKKSRQPASCRRFTASRAPSP